MVKKCKQCGRNLTSAESNKICENCRQKKRSKQLDAASGVIGKGENPKKYKA